MLISKAPTRISFLGGSTDYLEPAKLWGGLVLGTAINKYSYITCRYLPPLFKHKSKIVYSQIEEVASNHDIDHKFIKAALEYFGVEEGIELVHISDCPSKMGIGSSSSFMVCLIKAISALLNKDLSRFEILNIAIQLEQKLENVGLQDTCFATYGGLNYIEFRQGDARPIINTINISDSIIEELQYNTLLFYSGSERRASDVVGTYIKDLVTKEFEHKQLMNLARQGIDALYKGKLNELGKLIDRNWDIKRSLSPNISSPQIDNYVELIREAGGYVKLGGAGGSGILIVYAEPKNHVGIRQVLKDLLEIPFRFSWESVNTIKIG